jgi:hypothetical protein
MNTPGTSHSPWHLGTWSGYIARIVHPGSKVSLQGTPLHMTRRQELLAAQDQKRREQRAHVLELLREVKEKNRHNHIEDASFSNDHGKVKV